jgi:hypothetical protein
MDAWERLIRSGAVKCARPATEAQIARFEQQASISVHPSLREAWARANGIEVSRRLRILSVAEASDYIEPLEGRNIVALTDSLDSDPFCMSCDPILNGRIVRIYHDGAPDQLAFRSLDSFVAAVLEQLADGGVDVDGLPTDYAPHSPRSPEDLADGRRLAEAARDGLVDRKTEENWLAISLTQLACGLLSDVEALAPILAWPSEYARQSAEDRLHELGTEEALTALRSARRGKVRA